MSTNVTVLDYLLTGLCESVLKDEENDGIDVSAGLLGEYTSDWIRSVANGIGQNQALIAKQAERINIMRHALTEIKNTPSVRHDECSWMASVALEATKGQA